MNAQRNRRNTERTPNRLPHHFLFNTLAADTTSLIAASQPFFPDHRDYNRFTSDPESRSSESQWPIQSHSDQNPVSPSPRSRHAETIPRKKNHLHVSAFTGNAHSASRHASDRPSYKAHLITSVPTHEAHLRPIILLESRG